MPLALLLVQGASCMMVRMKKEEFAHTVVIGGGAIGAAVFYNLAKNGVDVALVERGECPWGSSKRCDGHAVTYDSPPGLFSRFCKKGLDLFPIVAKDLSVDIQFETSGIGLLVDNENDLPTLQSTLEGKLQEGLQANLWDQKELRYHEPHVADHIVACLNFMSDSKLNPMRLVFGLCQRGKEYGGRVFNYTSARRILEKNGKVYAVATDKGNISCTNVIICAGAWSPLLTHSLGFNLPVRPRQGAVLVTEKVKGLISKDYAEFGYLAAKGGIKRPGVSPEMELFGVAMVLEPSSDNTILNGSSRRFVGMDMEPHPAVLKAQAQRTIQFFPKFKEAKIIRSYAGFRPCSPDSKPIISDTPLDGLYVATAHEGNGIGLSLVTGELMFDIIQKNNLEREEVEAFSLSRFMDKE